MAFKKHNAIDDVKRSIEQIIERGQSWSLACASLFRQCDVFWIDRRGPRPRCLLLFSGKSACETLQRMYAIAAPGSVFFLNSSSNLSGIDKNHASNYRKRLIKLFAYEIERPIFNPEMNATITVFKYELKDNTELVNNISDMSSEIKETADAYAFSPKPGKLYELLNWLKESGVNYQTDFRE